MSSLPLTNSYFSRWLVYHQAVIDVMYNFQSLVGLGFASSTTGVKKWIVSDFRISKSKLLGGPRHQDLRHLTTIFGAYPLVNKHSYGKSPFLMEKPTINGHFQ